MKGVIKIKNIEELLPGDSSSADIRKKINCRIVNKDVVNSSLSYPVYPNAFVIILVLSGKGELQINYKPYLLEKGSVVLLSVSHLFNFNFCSDDFSGSCLLVSKDFMDEMDATEMIYRRIKYGVRMYNTPVLQVNETNLQLLNERIRAVDKSIVNSTHFHYKEMILNHLFAFYLDLSNIIENNISTEDDGNFTHYENLIKSFIELLIDHYREEHKVDFYSSRLNISSHYLTLIVKRITGQTVNDFIFELLYSEARNLLTHSKLSIQEITSSLHFSDQSSFSKFFKRKSGVTPIEFRKGNSVL